MNELEQYECLKQYKSRDIAIRTIEEEIEALYGHVPSPSFTRTGTSPKDGKRSVEKTIRRVEKLRQKQDALIDLQERCEEYVDDLEDLHVSNILRYRYIMGLTWQNTARAMAGTEEYSHLMRAVRNYYDKKKAQSEAG